MTSSNSRWLRLLLTALVTLATAGVVLLPSPASAAVIKPFTLNYDKTVYGDFIEVGNGNLRCPTLADRVLFVSGTTPAACAAGQKSGSAPEGNNSYFMVQGDVDSDPATFNSSVAGLTIPPGATVDFARLNWGGDTGRFKLGTGQFSTIPSCIIAGQSTPPGGAPAVLPPGTADSQKPRLTVGDGTPVDVTPASVTIDPEAAVNNSSEQYYSGFADVTSQFASAPTGTAVPVTVGNVWTPSGFNCFAGWSLVVVYKYSQLTPTFAPSKREVFIYDGHVRQAAVDKPTTTTVSNFRAAGSNSRVGLTTYEGDRQIAGDQFKINNTAVDNPTGGGSSTNFFVSHADSATDPGTFYNYNVGANAFRTALIPTGSTSASLSFSTSGDGYVAQNVVLSVPVPELLVTKSVTPARAHVGDPVTWTVAVTNPSDATVNSIVAADPSVPSCNRQIGSLAGGQSTTFSCRAPAPADDVTNVVNVAGKSELGDDVSGSGVAALDVIHPAITLSKTADKAAYRVGDTVTFTMVVTNAGDVPLSDVTVADPTTSSCARPAPGLGTIAAGDAVRYTCTSTAPIADNANTATVTGTDPLGARTAATDTAPAPVIHPAITIAKTASPSTVRVGETVTYTITVTNTGDSPLSAVTVADAQVAACSRTLPGSLAAGKSTTYTCTSAPTASVTNTAVATGTDTSGQDVTARDTAAVAVIRPVLSVVKRTDQPRYRTGDTVTFTLTVTNTGDVPLTDIAVNDATTPGCARTVGTLGPGASSNWTCTTVAGSTDFTNVADATGIDPTGRPVSDRGTADVQIVHPAVDIRKTVNPAVVRAGDTVTYTITVTNTGDVPLTDVAVADPTTPACAQRVPDLTAGHAATYTCTTVASSDDFSNTATVSATPPTGPGVTDSSTAAVDVIHPGISLVKTASPTVVRAGDTVTFALTVRNTGDVPLTAVTVADPTAPGCGNTFAAIAVSESRSYTCTLAAGTADFTNTATVAATPPAGPAVTGTDNAAVTVINPGITLTKTATPGTVHAGEDVTFTVTARNTGDVPLTNVVITDPRFPGCAGTIATLAAGATSVPIRCTVTAGAADVTNTAAVTASPPDGVPVSDTATATATVIHPGVAITKVADSGTVRRGESVNFTITVTNTGDVRLDPVVVADPTAADCARAVAALDPGQTLSFRCTATAPGADFTNTATVTGTDPLGGASTASDSATVDVVHPSVLLLKSVSPGNAQAGDPITYTISITNTGDVPLASITVTDPLVPGCTLAPSDPTVASLAPGATRTYDCPTISAPSDGFINTATVRAIPPDGTPVTSTGSTQLTVEHPAIEVTKVADVASARPGDPVTFTITVRNTGDVALTAAEVNDPAFTQCSRTIGALAVDQSVSFRCTVSAPSASFANSAIATGTPPSGPPVRGFDTATVAIVHPGLSITKNGPADPVRTGQRVSFDITVRNTGDVALTNVVVADPSTPDCARTLPALPVDGTQTFTCTAISGPDSFTNTATVTATDPLGHELTDTATAPVTVVHPSLAVTKTVNPAQVRVGDPIQYAITITNTGDVTLTDVTATDLTVGACTRTLPDPLAAGESVGYLCDAVAPADDVINTVSVVGAPPVGAPVTGTASAPLDVVHPALDLTKTTNSAAAVRPGDPVSFTLTVTNTGDVALTGVTVADPIAADCARTLGDLAVGQTVTYTCSMTALATSYVNTATATGQPPVGGAVTASSTSSVTVIHPALTILKQGPSTGVREGTTVTFTVTVTNTGDADLTDVAVTDPVTPACDRTIGALAVAQVVTYTCTTTAPAASFDNTATVVGTEPTGTPVSDTSTAPVLVVHPALTITKTASPTSVEAGVDVQFTITVRNTGDVDLVQAVIGDVIAPACARTVDRIRVGTGFSYTCVLTAPITSFTNVATVTATPVACPGAESPATCTTEVPGGPVTATASAPVTVIPGVINPPPPPPPGGGTTNPPPPGGGTTNPPPGSGGTPGSISNPPLPDTGVHASSMIRAAMLLGVLGLLMLAAGRRRRES